MIGKKLPALIEEPIYPRSTPAVSVLYPWCTHAQIPLFPIYPRPSCWPIPALHDQPPTYSWYNYAHYAQYRTIPDLISISCLKLIIQANVMPTDRFMWVQYPKCVHGPCCFKSDLKWCIHLTSISIFLYLCPPLKKEGHIALHMSVGMSVGRSVGRSVCRSVCR